MDAAASNNYLAFFFGLMMLGRFIGSFIVKKLGYLRATLFASLLASLSLSTGIFANLSIFIPLTGFFFSIIFPTLTAAVSDSEPQNINTTLGVLFTFSGMGGMIGPWLVAWSSDQFGLQTGFSTLIFLSAMTFLFIFILNNRRKHESDS